MAVRKLKLVGLALVLGITLGLVQTGTAFAQRCDSDADVLQQEALAEAGDAEAQFRIALLQSAGGCADDKPSAWRWFTRAADQGHPAALQQVASALYFGDLGVEQNRPRAVEYYKRAADAGNAFAQYRMGKFNQSGELMPQNYRAAAEWYKKGAEGGDVNAQFELGVAHLAGRGLTKNSYEALRWLDRSSRQFGAEPMAMIMLASMYKKGDGAPINVILAHKWLNIASSISKPGTDEAQLARTLREQLEGTMSTRAIALAQQAASEFKPSYDPAKFASRR